MHGGTLYLICIETVVKEANVLLKRSSKMQLIKLTKTHELSYSFT